MTSLSQLKAGSVIKIYPKDRKGTSHYGESKYALACSGDDQLLTFFEEAGSGDEWTLEDAGDGFCYLKNNMGYYWTYQGGDYWDQVKCSKNKNSAVKVSLTWDTEYSGVCFWNVMNGRGLHLRTFTDPWFNWNSSIDDVTRFDIALHKEGSGNDFTGGDNKEIIINDYGIKYKLYPSRTAEVLKNNYSGDIVIPETVTYNNITYKVTSLGESCFEGCSNLTSINLPSDITSLGTACFSSCGSLTSINLPSSITSLGSYCFSGCSSLTSISLPSGITSLGDWCFDGCSNLTSISLPDGLTSLGKWCFDGCYSLTSVLCLAVAPPSCTESVVDNTKRLYVPKESIEKYKQSDAWNSAKGIYPLYPTSSVSLAKEVSVNKTKPTKIEYTIMPEQKSWNGVRRIQRWHQLMPMAL